MYPTFEMGSGLWLGLVEVISIYGRPARLSFLKTVVCCELWAFNWWSFASAQSPPLLVALWRWPRGGLQEQKSKPGKRVHRIIASNNECQPTRKMIGEKLSYYRGPSIQCTPCYNGGLYAQYERPMGATSSCCTRKWGPSATWDALQVCEARLAYSMRFVMSSRRYACRWILMVATSKLAAQYICSTTLLLRHLVFIVFLL